MNLLLFEEGKKSFPKLSVREPTLLFQTRNLGPKSRIYMSKISISKGTNFTKNWSPSEWSRKSDVYTGRFLYEKIQ